MTGNYNCNCNNRNRQPSSAAGFTVLELMISLVLVAIVCGGMFASITIIGRAQATAAGIDVAQAGARAGFELISRDLESAAAGARGGIVYAAAGATAHIPSIVVTDSSTGPDRVDLMLVDPTVQTTLVVSLASGGTALTVNSSTGFSVGQLIQVTDFVSPTLYTITAIGSSANGPVLSVAANTNPLPRTYPPGSYVFASRSVSYYVDTTMFGTNDPLLMFDPDGPTGPLAGQPIAEGVEDFQVALGLDLQGTGILTSVGSVANDDDWVFNVAGETAPATLALLKSVRITLVAKPTSTLGGTRGLRPAAEDHAAASATDGYPRRVLKTEIAVRNFNL